MVGNENRLKQGLCMKRIILAIVMAMLPWSALAQTEGSTEPTVSTKTEWQAIVHQSVAGNVRIPPDLSETGPWGVFKLRVDFSVEPDGTLSSVELAGA